MASDKGKDGFVGRRFGKDGTLVIVRLIGQGGSGTIYMAWDEKHSRAVAIKFLHRDYSSHPVLLQRFVREGELFKQMDHPNIVKIFDSGSDHGRMYIVSEFVPGKNLYQVMKYEGAFALRRAFSICHDVASGLGEAHKHGIVHRDLKPENVMIRSNDEAVKILDFGIAKDLNSSDELTQLGTYIGTPSYSAPEQIRGEKVDHRADIFSLGVILYELITGKVAFDGRHSTEVLKATLRERPIPVAQLNNMVTSPVARIIDRMIEKQPLHRFQSMAQAIEEMQAVIPQLKDDFSEEETTSVRKELKTLFQK